MTPQEIDRIQNAIRHIQTAVDVDPWARDIAVEAMEKQILPSAQPERCEDCENFSKTRLLVPQPERKKGKWTKDNACEFCGFQPWYEGDIHTLSYCPNCGKDMRGDQDGQSD